MFETKYSKFLTVLLIIIIVAVIGLGGYLGYNYYKNYKVNSESDNYVSTFVEEVGDTNTQNNNSTTEESSNSISESINSADAGSKNKTKQTYKGFTVIGTIAIPKTGVNYPVLEDPPTVKNLEVAVAALYPQHAELNKPGNVVIVGHNYRNGLFFSNNKKLTNGDKIYITDLNKKRVIYTIYEVSQADKNDTSFYNRDTDGKMEITLSTCTDASNDQRIIVKARADQ